MTITWRRGSADPLVFQPVQPDGTPAPLADGVPSVGVMVMRTDVTIPASLDAAAAAMRACIG